MFRQGIPSDDIFEAEILARGEIVEQHANGPLWNLLEAVCQEASEEHLHNAKNPVMCQYEAGASQASLDIITRLLDIATERKAILARRNEAASGPKTSDDSGRTRQPFQPA